MKISTRFRPSPQSEHVRSIPFITPLTACLNLYQPPFGQTLAACHNLDSVDFQFYCRLWTGVDSRNELFAGPVAVLKGVQARDRRVKRLTLFESPSGPTRRAYTLVLPLQGAPEWIESVVDLV